LLPTVECAKNKVSYTIRLTRAVYSEEVFHVYQKYEKAVHNKDKTEQDLRRHLCNSPVYDPVHEASKIGQRLAPKDRFQIDQEWQRCETKEEGFEIQT
jgi:arginyl-tRNA--protein-N-Asp/Glu arginylyltransferase